MPISVPLVLEKSIAVIHRLNLSATASLQPYAGQTSGYDKDFKAPVTYDSTCRGRENARSEYPPIRVPCQVEVQRFERLDQKPPGNDPSSAITLVFHRRDLRRLQLITSDTGELLLKVNDRVSAIESYRRKGYRTVQISPPGLYIHELPPASFGFGRDGTDLFLAYLFEREKVV